MHKLELSDQHLAVLSEALANIAYRHAAPVVAEINRQLQAERESSSVSQDTDETC